MNGKKPGRTILLTAGTVLFLAVVLWIAWGNRALEVNRYTVWADNLPAAFEGYRIVHISDLHNAQMGKDNEKLLGAIAEAEPDMIAITGDIIDSRNTDMEAALQFVQEAVKIAPCYYVTGNHEARIPGYETLKQGLVQLGVAVLENASVAIEDGQDEFLLIGVDDPGFQTDYLFGEAEAVMEHHLKNLTENAVGFTVLLSHRPELFDCYVSNGIGLVLSGHAHGGQFRLPIAGGLIAPNQGLFPEYDAGMYTEAETTMIVSRGIGNSIIPFRINNRPEVVLVELKYKR